MTIFDQAKSTTDIFRVSVLPVNDPPTLSGIPDISVIQDSGFNSHVIDLFPYAADSDNTDDQLLFSVKAETNTALVDCAVSSDRYIDCTTIKQHGVGESYVTISVTDGQYTA